MSCDMKQYIRVGGVLSQEQVEDLFDKLGGGAEVKAYFCSILRTPTLSWCLNNGKIGGYCTESYYIDSGYKKIDLSEFDYLRKPSSFTTTINLDVVVTVNGTPIELNKVLVEKILEQYVQNLRGK